MTILDRDLDVSMTEGERGFADPSEGYSLDAQGRLSSLQGTGTENSIRHILTSAPATSGKQLPSRDPEYLAKRDSKAWKVLDKYRTRQRNEELMRLVKYGSVVIGGVIAVGLARRFFMSK